MPDLQRIAIDAMGGDGGVEVMLAGASLALKAQSDLHFLLVGDEPQIKSALGQHTALAAVSQILHVEAVVSGDEKPSPLGIPRVDRCGIATNFVI